MSSWPPASGPRAAEADHASPPRWALNPYRVAELLLGRPLPADDAQVGAQLVDAFRTKLESLFAPEPGAPTLLDVLRDPRFGAGSYPSVESALAALREIGGAAIAGFADEQLARLAPWLLPVDAEEGRPPGSGEGEVPTRRAVHGDRYLDGASFLDPCQGLVADCYLIAAMIAAAWTWPERFRERVASTAPAAGAPAWFRWRFDDAAPGARGPIEVDADVWIAGDGRPAYASSLDAREQWPGIAEKAYAMWREGIASRRDPSPASYRRIGGDLAQWPEEAGVALLGAGRGSRVQRLIGAERLSAHVAARRDANGTRSALVASTWSRQELAAAAASSAPAIRNDAEAVVRLFSEAGLVLQQNHAYAVLGVHEAGGQEYVVLRDPHAKDPARNGCARGSWRPGSSRHGVAELELGRAGVFALERGLFDQTFRWLSVVEVDG